MNRQGSGRWHRPSIILWQGSPTPEVGQCVVALCEKGQGKGKGGKEGRTLYVNWFLSSRRSSLVELGHLLLLLWLRLLGSTLV